MDQLKSELVIERKKVEFYQAMLERTRDELEATRVCCVIVSLSLTLLYCTTAVTANGVWFMQLDGSNSDSNKY